MHETVCAGRNPVGAIARQRSSPDVRLGVKQLKIPIRGSADLGAGGLENDSSTDGHSMVGKPLVIAA